MNLRDAAKRIASRHLSAGPEIPKALKEAIATMSSEIKRIFGFTMPSVEWRTSQHPDYEKDKQKTLLKDPKGFVTKDWGRIYVDLEKVKPEDYREYAAHEIGHFLDKETGGGSLFSSTVDLPAPQKDKPAEAFAMMVSYVVEEHHAGGPNQTVLYKALCKERDINPKGITVGCPGKPWDEI